MLNISEGDLQPMNAPSIDSPPAVTFRSITFSDGTTIELDQADVVVLVGPNNSGKSVALRELEDRIGNTGQSLVVLDAKLHYTGTPHGFVEFIRPYVQITWQGSNFNVAGNGFAIGVHDISDLCLAIFSTSAHCFAHVF